MRTLYIHAGQFKTGSSYIQSSLASSVEVLLENGIYYPRVGNFEAVATGRISSGNGALFLNLPDGLERIQREDAFKSCRNLLLSSEFFCTYLQKADQLAKLRLVREQWHLAEIRVLLFIRDPIEHAASEYQQLAKRRGFVGEPAEHFRQYQMPAIVADLIRALSDDDEVRITIKNYSRWKGDLLRCVASWLNVPVATLRAPATNRVNRSLSRAELYIQRILNRELGQEASFLADAFCEELPDIEPDVMLPSAEQQCAMIARLESAMQYVNDHAGEEESYDTSILEESAADNEKFVYSREQVSVIARAFASKIHAVERELAKARAVSTFHVGVARRLSGKAEEARRLFRKALEENPDYVPALLQVASDLIRDDKDPEGALEYIERAGRLAPDNPKVGSLGELARRMMAEKAT